MIYEIKTKRIEYMALPKLARPSFIHFHNEVEIVINMGEGASANAYINAKKYPLKNFGDAVIVTPGQVHSFETLSEGLFMAFIFPAEYIPRLNKALLTMQPTNPFFNLKETEVENIIMDFWKAHGDVPYDIKHVRSSVIIGYMNILMAHLYYKLNFTESDSDKSLISKIIMYLTENYKEQITLKGLSEHFNIPHPVISKAFNLATGITVPSFINWIRVSSAAELLNSSNMNITEISSDVGFRTIRNFNRAFVEFYSVTPSEYREIHK